MKPLYWAAKLVITACVTSIICVTSTFWVIQTYVDMILEQYKLKNVVNDMPNWSKFTAHVSETLTGQQPGEGRSSSTVGAAARTGQAPEAHSVTGQVDAGTQGANGNSDSAAGDAGQISSPTQSTGADNVTEEKVPDDAVAVFGHQSGSAAAASSQQESNSSSGEHNKASGTEAGSRDGTGGRATVSGTARDSGQESTESGLAQDGSAGSAAGAESDVGGRVVVSGEEFARKKELLSTGDRNKIFNMMLSRVPQTEIQSISQMMEEGITASELKQIEQTLQQYLKPEEYSQLLGMIKTKQ
ncbi:hypothetical protein [Paenibacillus xerothermodurans]|uniref:Spore coat protein n=1 Tax=Paenibacillus xerothermodurans TaxID=1977292 RepID=A0A2W1N5F4_PAEXE|nr:hypothetical protein [Paenibacillus xerothermodurans]PZE19064.1 hypothetical protein CBW46_020395 [Paenibacillus xerothermodurans]